MRVLILHSRYTSGPVSGENRVVDDEAELLKNSGHEVEVWDPSVGESGGSSLRLGISNVWSHAAVSEAQTRVRRFRPEVVHVHNLFPALSPAVLRTSGTVPIVMTLHNYRLFCLPGTLFRDGRVCELCLGRSPLPGIRYRCYRDSAAASLAMAASLVVHNTIKTFDRISLFIAVSAFVRDKYIEGGVPPDRITVKPNFCPARKVRSGPGSGFLILGRLAPEKGIDTVFRAWEPDLGHLTIAGDGPMSDELRAEAGDGVTFLGTVSPERVVDLVRAARAVLVPSQWYEAAPRTITEAYAAGVPVIASRIGALPEAVDDGKTGILVTPDNDGEWTRAMRLLMNDDVSQRMGREAVNRWRRDHTPESAVLALEETYRLAISG